MEHGAWRAWTAKRRLDSYSHSQTYFQLKPKSMFVSQSRSFFLSSSLFFFFFGQSVNRSWPSYLRFGRHAKRTEREREGGRESWLEDSNNNSYPPPEGSCCSPWLTLWQLCREVFNLLICQVPWADRELIDLYCTNSFHTPNPRSLPASRACQSFKKQLKSRCIVLAMLYHMLTWKSLGWLWSLLYQMLVRGLRDISRRSLATILFKCHPQQPYVMPAPIYI